MTCIIARLCGDVMIATPDERDSCAALDCSPWRSVLVDGAPRRRRWRPAQPQRSPCAHAGGEANLVLPDLSTVSFLGIDGHTLLLAGLVVCALGLLFGARDRTRSSRTCRCTSRCARSRS